MSQPRHQTLRASLDWSWQLLNEKEQHLLIHSAAFAGSFSAQAAASVSGEVGELALTEALLTQLRDQGLVQEIGGAGGERRYQLLETVRQYISERLVQCGEDTFVRQRHACYYLELAEEATPRLERAEQEMALKQLELEHDNLHAALRHLISSGQAELAQREAGALWRFWYYRGHLSEGRELLAAALALDIPAPPTVHALALLGLGCLLWVQGEDAAARPHLVEALRLYREAGERRGEARTLHALGTAGGAGANANTLWCFEESIRIKRELGDCWGLAHTLGNLANGYAVSGERSRARQLREEALAIWRALGDEWGMAVNLNDIGSSLKEDGDYVRGQVHLEEALNIRRQLGDKSGIASTLLELTDMALLLGDFDNATRWLAEGRKLFAELEDSRGIAGGWQLEGRLALAYGQTAAAEAALRRAAEMRQEELTEPTVLYSHLLWQAGLFQARGDAPHAAVFYGALSQIATTTWLHLAPIYEREQLAGMARAATLIGEAAFSIYFQHGKKLSTEALTRYLIYGWEPTADDERAGEEASSGNPTCSSCSGNPLLVRAGYNRSGSSRYQCPICRRRTTIAGHQRGHAAGVRQQAVALYRSGCSLRQIATQLGVSHQSVANWLKQKSGN